MANPLTDKLNIGDAGVRVGLACAKCGVSVASNQPHECAVKSTDTEKERENETDKT